MIELVRSKVSGILPDAGEISPASQARIGLVALAAALLLFVLAALVMPMDISRLVTGDPLYVIQMLDFGILEYRPPLSNRWIPDGLLHLVLAPLALDPAWQMIVVGSIIFLATSVAILGTKGEGALALYLLVLSTAGFAFVDSINHFALPICVLAYLWARGRAIELPLLAIVVFSDPLILFPLALILVERDEPPRQARRVVTVAAAFLLNTIYSEFSSSFVMLLAAFPLWVVGVWVVNRLGLRTWFCLAVVTMLPIAVVLGIVPVRYGIPIAAAMVTLLPWGAAAVRWHAILLPGVVLALFLASARWERHDQIVADYDCLVEEIGRRDIDMIATDHWNAKPLYFAAKSVGRDLGIVQVRFDSGTVHSHMAPYSFYGAPTRWAVRGLDTCEVDGAWTALFCGQPEVAPVVSAEGVCRSFELYEYAVDLPLRPESRPAGKMESLRRNVGDYVYKARRLVGL